MMVISLQPTLDACIETQAKRLFKETASCLMKTPYDSQLRNQFEILKIFLEQADFHKLRAESEPSLLVGNKVIYEVWSEGQKAHWEMRTQA
jgi:hypothetical protein